MRFWLLSTFLSLGIVSYAVSDHGPLTWANSHQSVVRVMPTWPGYERPGFGAPMGSAPMGSGVFWSLAKGQPTVWVLTAAHVIANAERIEIETPDGRRVDVEVAVIDTDADLALLQAPFSQTGLTLVTEEPLVGSHACALGYPFGLPLSLSCGVVSGVNRSGLGFNAFEDFIQTDAAVNPGGSGGALVNAQGELIGLVSAIFTKEADIDAGVNFAVSADAISARLASQLTQ